MAQLIDILARLELLDPIYLDPAIPAWNRIEARPRDEDFSRSLRAEVRDALWMLTRQWQTGELEAEDAGSPIDARLLTRRATIDRVRIAGGPVQPYDDEVPLEALVECEPIPFTQALRLQVGQFFLDLHSPALRTKYLPRYREKFPFPQAAEADFTGQVDGLNLYLATRRGGFDGKALRVALEDGSFAAKVPVDPGDAGDLQTYGEQLLAWFERQFTRPPAGESSGWDHERLSYSLAAAAPDGGDKQLVLSAERYQDGYLDWDSFDLDPVAAPLELPSPPPPDPEEETLSFIPVAASFKGMPDPRFWKIEERAVNFGALNAKTTDQLLLVFAEMGLIYGNDWYVIPYQLPVNSLCQVEGLVVTDVFGDRTLIPAADEGSAEDWRRWSLFELGNRAEIGSYNHQFLLPSTVGEGAESEPLERVQYVRDEMSNMVWAIEEVIPDATGAGIDGYDAAGRTGVLPEPIAHSPAAIRYLLGTTVPENWIPFLPAQRPGSIEDIAFQRAAMPKLGTPTPELVKPKGVLLNEPTVPWFVDEEEISVSGVSVTRAFQRVRWYDGRTFVWIGRRRETGRGAGSSSLRFDQIEPTEGAGA
ncbi:MAG TPA: hypothetical protein VJL81_02350 [Solirubrobacterales bacterium]|nr:hypothetical protein [Solirubrobacterales bacterium]